MMEVSENPEEWAALKTRPSMLGSALERTFMHFSTVVKRGRTMRLGQKLLDQLTADAQELGLGYDGCAHNNLCMYISCIQFRFATFTSGPRSPG